MLSLTSACSAPAPEIRYVPVPVRLYVRPEEPIRPEVRRKMRDAIEQVDRLRDEIR